MKEQKQTRRLEARNLFKAYGKRAVVKDVSFSVESRQVVGLLGPNGAGKTTSFYMVVGLVRPDDGVVFLDGQDVSQLPMFQRARLGVGYLPQEPSVFRKMTVEDNLMAVLENTGFSYARRREQLSHLLEDFNVRHVSKQFAYTLSGGERRRVEVARALALDPAFILLDEPFAGVDPLAVADIQGIIRKLKDRGLGILITDHNVRETLGICDLGYILSDGTILENGTPEQIAQSPRAREAYLGENFRL
ncbi:MAG: LPS export ABC transporter ATP-binding protein [Deltaproteobacteria bacterium]|nr:LPS export ABC transporter ATP-binding protein [Deltaproteobacteria bacterium]